MQKTITSKKQNSSNETLSNLRFTADENYKIYSPRVVEPDLVRDIDKFKALFKKTEMSLSTSGENTASETISSDKVLPLENLCSLERKLFRLHTIVGNFDRAMSLDKINIENDPVYANTTNPVLRKAIEERHLEGRSSKEFKEMYIAELDMLQFAGITKLSPVEYEQYKFMTTFSSFIDYGNYNGDETTPLKEWPRSTNIRPELVKSFGIPRHAACLKTLKELFPDTEFQLSRIEIPGEPLPAYIISFEVTDESNFGLHRNVKIQISNQKGKKCLIDNGLLEGFVLDLPLEAKYEDLSKQLLNIINPITPALKHEYHNMKLILATMARESVDAKNLLNLGADPTWQYRGDFCSLINSMADLTSLYLDVPKPTDFNGSFALAKEAPLEIYALAKIINKTMLEHAPEKIVKLPPAIMLNCTYAISLDKISPSDSQHTSLRFKAPNIYLMGLFMDAGADIDALYHFTSNEDVISGTNPLYSAIKICDQKLVQFLIDNEVNCDCRYNTASGYTTALFQAIEVEEKKLFSVLAPEKKVSALQCFFLNKVKMPISSIIYNHLDIEPDALFRLAATME